MAVAENNKKVGTQKKSKLAIISIFIPLIILFSWILLICSHLFIKEEYLIFWYYLSRVVLFITCSLPLSLIFGVIAIVKGRRCQKKPKERLLATIGITTSIILIALFLYVIFEFQHYRHEDLAKRLARRLDEMSLQGNLAEIESIFALMPELITEKEYLNYVLLMPPLHNAALNGHEDVVRFLLDKGDDINIKDPFIGETALHKTARNNCMSVAALLIAKGIDVNAQSNDGLTALHLAAFNGYEGVVKILVWSGATINIKDNNGMTPLHLAAFNNHPEMLELLISLGGDASIKDNEGYTPLAKDRRIYLVPKEKFYLPE